MAYENIQFKYSNFCIAPITDTYGSIDTTNATAVLQIRNSSGIVQTNFDVNPTFSQGFSISDIKYVGPRSVTAYKDYMPFFTLEHNSSTQCTVKRWDLNDTDNRLDLAETFTFSNTGSYRFNCYTMSVEHYATSFMQATATGTGVIRINSTFRDKIEVGDTLYLGPSANTGNPGAFELVEVTSIDTSYFYIDSITSSGTTAPLNQYNSNDAINFYKDIFLFSDTGLDDDTSVGTLYKINGRTGTVKETHESGLYNAVRASTWGLPYGNTIAFIKNSNLFYVDKDDYEVKKSAALNNVKSDETTVIPCYSLEVTTNTIYRLQNQTVRRDDNGNLANYSWSSYNYQPDGVFPYVDSISLWTEPSWLHNEEATILYALVRDQYGSVVPNQTVYFERESGDTSGSFGDPSKEDTTSSGGLASIGYTAGWSDPNVADSCCDTIVFSVYTDGSNTYTGSQYVWGFNNVLLWYKFIRAGIEIECLPTTSGSWPGPGSILYTETHLRQLEEFTSTLNVPCLSKFWFPGGHGDAPSSSVPLIRQIRDKESELWVRQLPPEVEGTMPIRQISQQVNNLQLSQTHISRHILDANKDDATINQFRFLLDARPTFWSEKNSTDTDIWVKLAPFGFNLDASTLSFKVREASYAGDTGYVEYKGTPYLSTVTFDAGGGLLGIEVTCDPPGLFHHNAVVYVRLEIYDTAIPPNKIWLDYWFKILPDYKAPYIINEYPAREAFDIAVDTHIEFDIYDQGVGVDIDSLEVYVNNRIKGVTITPIAGGYHVYYQPASTFQYGQSVEVSVRAQDASDNANKLFDTFRFHCVGSTGPWFDMDSIYPENCKYGVYRHLGYIAMNVYEVDDTGLNRNTIRVTIDDIERQMRVTPIIYRIM